MPKRIDTAQTELFTPLELVGNPERVEDALRRFLYGKWGGRYQMSLSTTINTIWTRWEELGAQAEEWKLYVEHCFIVPARLALGWAGKPREKQAAKRRIVELQELGAMAMAMIERDHQDAVNGVRKVVCDQWVAAKVDAEISELAITTFGEWITDQWVRENQHATTLRNLARGALARHQPEKKKAAETKQPAGKTGSPATKKTSSKKKRGAEKQG